MKTIYLLRINSKLRTRDDNPDDNGLIVDDIEIDEEETRKTIQPYLQTFRHVTNIIVSPALRAQQTALVLLESLEHENLNPRVEIEIGISGFVNDEEKNSQFTIYRIKGKGLLAEGDFPNCVPAQSRWAALFPSIKIDTADYWQLLKAFFEVDEQNFKPFWTAKKIGERGVVVLENIIQTSEGDCIVISHSGVIEPLLACALGVEISDIIEALDDKRLEFLESVSLTHKQGKGFVEANIRGNKIRGRIKR